MDMINDILLVFVFAVGLGVCAKSAYELLQSMYVWIRNEIRYQAWKKSKKYNKIYPLKWHSMKNKMPIKGNILAVNEDTGEFIVTVAGFKIDELKNFTHWAYINLPNAITLKLT